MSDALDSDTNQRSHSMIQIAYCSAAVGSFETSDLDDILRVARTKNNDVNVTGMLLYENGSFFQTLEGAPGDVDKVFERIECDPRHKKISMLLRRDINERSFSDWTMGYARFTLGELSTTVGLNDVFQEGTAFAAMDTSQVKKLIRLFRDGSYRQRIE
jgi:hypothetical protein